MHLWGPEGTIKRYNSPQEIMEDFFPVRLKFYESRKQRLEDNLTRLLTDLENKHRFCKMVIDGSLKVFKRSKAEIEATLTELGFAMQNKSFSYLLGISMLDLTADKLVDLEKKLDTRRKELEVLAKKTPRALWKDDLRQLEKKLAKGKD
jgi:DNA topoisomerase-2